MSVINTGAIQKALVPVVNTWFGLKYDAIPKRWSEMYEINRSERNFEEDVNVWGSGLAQVKNETEGVRYDTMQQGGYQRYIHATVALAIAVSREEMEDNLYPELAKARTEGLSFSMNQTKEVIAANLLNNAFSSSYFTTFDGQSLGSASHKLTKGGTYSNMPAAATDLSEASVEQACIDIMGFYNDAGLRIMAEARKLMVPRQLMFEARRILKSPDRYNTAERSISAIYSMDAVPEGVLVNTFFSTQRGWFMLTNIPRGLVMFQRRDVGIDNDTDFDTENMKFKASERYSFGCTDPKGIYCVNLP